MESKGGDQNKTCEATNKCRVIILGGGIAGLSAANHLIKNGVRDFRILEARKRLGGRVISLELTKHRVELGANWIHGVLGNPIFELAMSNSLVDIVSAPKPHKVIAATADGKQVPFGVLHEIYEAYVCFLRRCEEYFLCQYAPPPDVHSVGEHINLEAAIYLENLPSPQERKLRRQIFDCLLKRETCISGCTTMDEIDLLELGSYTELQGGNIMLPTGYSSILEPLTRNIDPHCILSGRPVVKVYWDRVQNRDDTGDESDDSDKTVIEDLSKSKDVTPPPSDPRPQSRVETGDNTHLVEVVCENGEKYYAEHVICTLPLGVLKEMASTIFVPRLPDYKTEAIERLLFGTVDKIFLEYDRPFLNPNITEIMLLWDNNDVEEDIKQCWFKKIYSFAKVTETLLLAWVSGKEAEYMETLSSEAVSKTCTTILRQFLNDPYVPEPQRCVCTSWKSQPFTRGSYTAIAVGATQSDIESIAEPLFTDTSHSKPVLLFAGEHAHSNFYSTVHGAYLSGRVAAQHLLTSAQNREVVVECETGDLSSWIQGLSLQ